MTKNSTPQELLYLAVDTSSPQGSLVLWKQGPCDSGGQLLCSKEWIKKRSHSEVITSAAEELLHQNNLKWKDLSALVTGVGPGSFTGVRVAINFVRSLGYALNIPIFTVNSLKLLAIPHITQKTPVLCMVNAYKNLIYSASYRMSDENFIVEEMSPSAISAIQLEEKIKTPHLVVGDGWSLFQPQFSDLWLKFIKYDSQLEIYPHAKNILDLPPDDLDINSPKDWKNINPLYIRDSEAEEKLRTGLLQPTPKI